MQKPVNLPSLVQHQVCLSHPIVLQKQVRLIVYVMPPGFEDDPTVAHNIRCLQQGGGVALI